MFEYWPEAVLGRVAAPIVAIRRITPGDDGATDPRAAFPAGVAPGGLTVVDVPAPGHNLLRYRPDEVTAEIVGR